MSGTSRAYIGDGTRLSAGSLTVEVRNSLTTPPSAAHCGPPPRPPRSAAVGILAGAGSSSTAVINGSLEAFIGSNATVVVGGATTVRALGNASATADAQGGSGGGVAISVFFATACVSGYSVDADKRTACTTPAAGTVGTRAYVGAGTDLTTGSLEVGSTGTDTATATVLAVAVALLAGVGGDANASVTSEVQSWIGTTSGASHHDGRRDRRRRRGGHRVALRHRHQHRRCRRP